MISRIVLAVLIGASFSFSQSPIQSQGPTPQTAAAKQYFIAIFSKGPAWDEAKPANEQIGFKELSDNLRRLRADKRITIGGRYADKGMVIVEAKNKDEAQALFAADAMVLKNTFTLELHAFQPFYKGALE